MEKKAYQLVGYMDILGEHTELVQPIFSEGTHFYFQVCDFTTVIDRFVPIKEEDHIAMIHPISEDCPIFGERQKTYKPGNDSVIALRSGENLVFLGNMDSFQELLKTIDIVDPLMQDEIRSMENNHHRSKQYKKKKEFQSTTM